MTAHDEPSGVERMAGVLRERFGDSLMAVFTDTDGQRSMRLPTHEEVAAALAEAGIGVLPRRPERDHRCPTCANCVVMEAAVKRADAAEARLREVEAELESESRYAESLTRINEKRNREIGELKAERDDWQGAANTWQVAAEKAEERANALLRATQGSRDEGET